MIVVATDAERKLASERWPRETIIQTGVGALNVISTLIGFDRDVEIINFGYAGSNNIEVGTEVCVGACSLHHPSVEYEEPLYRLGGETPCFTSSDFVTHTNVEEPAVFDMELAYILALGFKNVKSIKVVSDNLSLQEYERQVEKDV